MELHQAISEISEIRAQIARTETFRGYRSATVAATGLLAIVGSVLQSIYISAPQHEVTAYLTLWIGVAVISMALTGSEIAVRSLRAASPYTTRMTLLAVEQFLPCVLAGAALTAVIAHVAAENLWMLPGLWALLFSLGVFASCRLLPHPTFWVAAFYLVAGITLLGVARGEYACSPWAMGVTFGSGQLAAAAILYFHLERNHG